jgi:hypothetical protein
MLIYQFSNLIINIFHFVLNTGHGLSGRDRKQRQGVLRAKLLEGFEQCDGKEVEQSIVLHYLELTDTEKSLATRVVLSAFPSCSIKRVMRSGRN